ncbi:hypothetical protein [Vitreimonas flagellata]|uniref:hypothetical protein n=1 Tax=Vitreimonas flagellata TaxID=2560861 RepID=UPI001075851C|nr:hypothetical protein [Vitreimonas flagellata]
MQHIAPATLTKEELERQQRSLFLWLVWAVLLVLRLGTNAHRSKSLERIISKCERFVHAHLICVALSRLRFNARAPLNVAQGVRVHKAHPRLLARSFRKRNASFYGCILHALHMFNHAERYIARLTRKLRGAPVHLVLATPTMVALRSAEPRAIACADSS